MFDIARLPAAAAFLLASAAWAQAPEPGAHFIENWDLDGNGAVTQTEAETKRDELFVMFDADEDGYLGPEEYALFDETRATDMEIATGGSGLGPMQAVEEAMSLEYNDVNGDGQVSSAEFLGRTGAWFLDMDANGDGELTAVDFRRNY